SGTKEPKEKAKGTKEEAKEEAKEAKEGAEGNQEEVKAESEETKEEAKETKEEAKGTEEAVEEKKKTKETKEEGAEGAEEEAAEGGGRRPRRVWRERAGGGEGRPAVVGADLLVIALALDGHEDHGDEEDGGDGAQGDDEDEREVDGGQGLVGVGPGGEVDEDEGGGGEGGVAVVAGDDDELEGRLGGVVEGPGGADLAAVRVDAEEGPVAVGGGLVGQPAVVAVVVVGGADDGDQVAGPGAAGHRHLGRAVDQRRGGDDGRVVVGVEDDDPDGGVGLQRGAAAVAGQDAELEGPGLLVVEGAQGVDVAGAGVDRHVGEDRHVPHLRRRDLVGHAAVGAQVRVAGRDRQQVGPGRVVLRHGHPVAGLGEARRVVVLVGDPDGEGLGALQRRGPAVAGLQGEVVAVALLAVQPAVHQHGGEALVVLQAEGHAAQEAAADAAVGPRVAVGGPHQGDDIARRGGLAHLHLLAVHRQQVDDGRVVVDVQQVHGDLAVGRHGVGPPVLGLHVQLVGAGLLVVQRAAHRHQPAAGVQVEEAAGPLARVAAERVDHLAVGALVRVRGVELDDRRAGRRVLRQADGVGRLGEDRVVVVGVGHPDGQRRRALARRVAAVPRRQPVGVARLGLPVQRPLHHQLGEARPVAAGLHLQPEEVAGAQLVGLHAQGARVRVVGAVQRQPGARAGRLRDLQLHGVGGEAGRVVVQVPDLHLHGADLQGARHHLQRDGALGARPAQQLPVDLLLGHQQARPGVEVHQVRGRVGHHAEARRRLPRVQGEARRPGVAPHVPDHRPRPLLLVHRVLQVHQGRRPRPQPGRQQRRGEPGIHGPPEPPTAPPCLSTCWPRRRRAGSTSRKAGIGKRPGAGQRRKGRGRIGGEGEDGRRRLRTFPPPRREPCDLP
uniref:Uncharacterized protein n=1 Tax=Ornithorhynchus anatinus TaxID=9258 RepID=A0A6I8PK29_ORNAN